MGLPVPLPQQAGGLPRGCHKVPRDLCHNDISIQIDDFIDVSEEVGKVEAHERCLPVSATVGQVGELVVTLVQLSDGHRKMVGFQLSEGVDLPGLQIAVEEVEVVVGIRGHGFPGGGHHHDGGDEEVAVGEGREMDGIHGFPFVRGGLIKIRLGTNVLCPRFNLARSASADKKKGIVSSSVSGGT